MHRRRILLVDDDRAVLDQARPGLEEEGFVVSSAVSISEAMSRLSRTPVPDAVILDISLDRKLRGSGLPEDGLELLKWIREGIDVPVVMLSAMHAESVKVLALNLGADDYVTKPFSPQELAARIQAVLRRVKSTDSAASELLDFGALVIDAARYAVFRDEEALELTLREFRVLEILARAQGKVLTRRAIMDAAWGRDHHAVERTVDVHVRHLREKLETDPAKPAIILTVRGVGYRFGLLPRKR